MILAWILLSFVVAIIGTDRKIGYWGTFFLSLLLSPIIGAIFALASERKSKSKSEIEKLPQETYNFYSYARKEFKKGNFNQAINFLNDAKKLSPRSPLILINLAICHAGIKDKEKGFYYLDKAVQYGYKNFQHIQQQNILSFLRQQPEFNAFVENGYRLPKDSNKDDQNDSVAKLEKLAQLKEKGILTDIEFEIEKKKIINQQ